VVKTLSLNSFISFSLVNKFFLTSRLSRSITDLVDVFKETTDAADSSAYRLCGIVRIYNLHRPRLCVQSWMRC
jgi:hypothetical protein